MSRLSRPRLIVADDHRMVAEGLTYPEIATRLGISAETVETHLSNVMNKLDLHTQADLIRFALRRGILLMED